MDNLDQAFFLHDQLAFNPRYETTSTKDDRQAVEDMYNDIKAGAPWDENLEGHRADMLVEIEAVLRSDSDEKLALINDIYHLRVLAYCETIVKYGA